MNKHLKKSQELLEENDSMETTLLALTHALLGQAVEVEKLVNLMGTEQSIRFDLHAISLKLQHMVTLLGEIKHKS